MRGIPYSKEEHFDNCITIWKDAGWLEKGQEKLAENWFNSADALVGENNGEAVALALSHIGTFNHISHLNELPFCAVTGITVAFHGRKLGFAGTLTAELLARAAGRGEVVAGLGMFEQGFYDKVGFGNYPYMKVVYFRPSELLITGSPQRLPRRLSNSDWEMIHKNRSERPRCHGSVNLPPLLTRAEMELNKKSFTMGFFSETGSLTHHYVVSSVKGEHGPMRIAWAVFNTPEQFKDILLSIKSFGDQIDLISIHEPPGIQFQSLLSKPMSSNRQCSDSTGSKAGIRTACWTQCRILNLIECTNGMVFHGKPCSFNLIMTDPVDRYLDSSFNWRGCGGEYTVRFSNSSSAERGCTEGLPVMRCSVNTFTRLWNGSSSASMLPYTDEIEAPAELLRELDDTLRLPEPSYDWDF